MILSIFLASALAVGQVPDWASGFNLAGTDGTVNAITEFQGAIFYGGSFLTAGGLAVNGLVKVDKTTGVISVTGPGIGGTRPAISAMIVFNRELVLAGKFTSVDGVAVNNIAKWNGSTWSALGSGVTSGSTIADLAVVGSNLYAAGTFTSAGGLPASQIARWDGTSWSPLGSGLAGGSGTGALAFVGSTLYAGGNFTTAGGLAANGFARWDGTSWSVPTAGVNSGARVAALFADGFDLYAGGDFTTVGGAAASRIAKFDGVSWSALGSGMDGTVTAITMAGTNLFAAGSFTSAGGVSATNVAAWNGSAWNALDTGTSSAVSCVVSDGSSVLAGGQFLTAGNAFVRSAARWTVSGWQAAIPGNGTNAIVKAVVDGGDAIYVGGSFTAAGGVVASRVARWNKTTRLWSALGSGMNGDVSALAMVGSDLFAGGAFTTAGGAPANHVARWDGTAWLPLGTAAQNGTDGTVAALCASGSDLYVGGDFFTVSDLVVAGLLANNIAKWNPVTRLWSKLGSALQNGVTGSTDSVSALASAGESVYVGGKFSSADGVNCQNIAEWNPATQTWSALSSSTGPNGASGPVFAITSRGSYLFVAGAFSTVFDSIQANLPANNIAKWSRSSRTWSLLSSSSQNGVAGAVNSLAVAGADIYAGGTFTAVSDATQNALPASRVARWSTVTSAWSSAGSGTDGIVQTLAVIDGNLFAGGSITTAGAKPSSSFGRYGPVTGGLTPLEIWRKSWFGFTGNTSSAADAYDYDRDGIANIAEYAFGLNPLQAGGGDFCHTQIQGGNLVLTFDAPPGASGIIYGAEWSATLPSQSWMPVADSGTGNQHVFSVPLNSAAQLFMRFKATVE